jgi:hypothetical protein
MLLVAAGFRLGWQRPEGLGHLFEGQLVSE